MAKRSGTIAQRGERSWRIRYYNNDGLRQAETITGTRDDAERQLAIRMGEIAKGLPVSSKPNAVLFGELADDVLTDYEVNDYATTEDAETRFRLHLNRTFGKRKAAQITMAQIKTYIKLRQEEGAKPGTINRELELMRHTFRLAMQGRKLHHMPHVPMLREDNVRSGFFTRDEVVRLCSHMKEPYASFTMFGFLTGWRYSEIQGLLWRNVDFKHGEIRLDVGTDKNRAGRVFPMSVELRALLDEAKARAKKAVPVSGKTTTITKEVIALDVVALAKPVFAIAGAPVGAFRKTWKTACHKAGLPCIVDKETGRPIKAIRLFHDLRRSAAREMASQGIREGVIMKLMGWKTRSVFDRYNVVSDGDLRDAIELLDGKRANIGANKRS